MKKHGFTLIELLAVIVILGVIALIATPLVMNTIEESRKSSFQISVQHMVSAIRTDQANQDYIAVYYTFPLSANSTLKLDGDTSEWVGSAEIDEEGKIAFAVFNGKYCAYKTKNDFDFQVVTGKSQSECLAFYQS